MYRFPRNERLEWARLRAGLSQGELADAVHASRETINAIERCRRTPSLWLALAIAHALNEEVEVLFGANELR